MTALVRHTNVANTWLYAFRDMKTRFVGKEMAHVPLAHCQRLINMHEINTEV